MLPNPQETANLVTFTEEILNGKLLSLCSECCQTKSIKKIKKMYGNICGHIIL